MVTFVTVASGIEGYNPPEYYRTLTNLNPDIFNFVSEISSKALYGMGNIECKNDIFHNMGKCTINYSNKYLTYNMGIIFVNDTYYDLIGKVDSWEFVAEGILEISYTIDWYTSVILNQRRNASAPPTAKTILYRRLTDGEFTYSDEGMTPHSVKATTIQLDATGDDKYFYYWDENNVRVAYTRYDGNFFNYGGYPYTTPEYIVYHYSKDDVTIKAICIGVSLSDTQDFINFLGYFGITASSQDIDPDDLIFRGFLPMPAPIAIRGCKRMGGGVPDTMFGVYAMGSNRPINPYPFYLHAHSNAGACSEYNKLRIETGDGAIIYDLPLGKTLSHTIHFDSNGDVIESQDDTIKVTAYMSSSVRSPVVTFKIESANWKASSTTFTIPVYQDMYFKDSYQVYRSQEREYQKAMLSLQSQNELASGVIGGINQGAMISAFSRNQTSTGTDKGIIGGGMAVISAGLNFLYQDLYANKKATEINDEYNRCKPDVLAQDGSMDYGLLQSNSGLRAYTYDDVTVANIQAYQSAFGYSTNKVDTNVALNTFTGYVQADILFDRRQYLTSFYNYAGLIEKYIKNMFNYGVYFTKVA